MPGKPFQSKLNPHEDEIFALLDAGQSFRQVAERLNRSHGLGVTHNAVFSFAKSRRKRRGARLFFEGLSPDIRDQMLKQIAAVWTHGNAAPAQLLQAEEFAKRSAIPPHQRNGQLRVLAGGGFAWIPEARREAGQSHEAVTLDGHAKRIEFALRCERLVKS